MLRVYKTLIVILFWIIMVSSSYCVAMWLLPRHGNIVGAISAIVATIVLIIAILISTKENVALKKIANVYA